MNDTALARSKALADQQDSLNEILATRYTETSYQVWVKTPSGGLYAYRDNLIYSVASAWTVAWNKDTPADVDPGTTFHVVEAKTTFRNV